ncbi:serine/threonine-protein phosphatase 7 long form homolog [Apium graveolens]|uniref:serine/threonine-protein phosphatase 7 long form homolog n=1 Tax=Apium graveolens TaxID=4045 RepID=UPI003D79E8AE
MGEVTITLQDVGILSRLHVDGDVVISDVTPGPGMSWPTYVGEIFGSTPDPKKDMNGSRVRLTFISSCAPPHLPHDASACDIRFQVLCYLVHLCGGVLFTDYSGGLFHSIFLHFLRDLDICGDYACGLQFLHICIGSYARQAKRTLMRWLYGHSYTTTGGHTLPFIQTLLDGFGPSQFIWEPYPLDVIADLPAYCLTCERIWRYRGPLICIFIVEIHCSDIVSRQFGLVQTIHVDVVYSEAEHSTNLRGNDKIRWIQKHAASISIWIFERTQDVLPDVSHFTDQCYDFVREYTLHGFGEMPVEVRRARHLEERQQLARRARRGDLGDDRLPLHTYSHDVPESSTHARTDLIATDLGDGRDPPIRVSVADTVR